MKRVLTIAGFPAIASALVPLLGATSPSLGQNPNYDLPGYIPNRGTATGGPAGGPDQRKAKVSHKKARKASKPQ